MDDPAGEQTAVGFEQIQHVLVRIPHMEAHGHVHRTGQLQLLQANLLLHLPGRQVVVVVQADFPQGNHLFLPKPRGQQVKVAVLHGLGLMGMNSHRGIAALMGLGEVRRMAGGGHVRADDGIPGHAPLPHAKERLVPVAIELRLIYMAVGIKQLHHPMMAPSSTPSPTDTRCRLPLSSTAERIMPWLSMPAMGRGFRLVIATTCRPTSSSG